MRKRYEIRCNEDVLDEYASALRRILFHVFKSRALKYGNYPLDCTNRFLEGVRILLVVIFFLVVCREVGYITLVVYYI